MTLVTDAGYGSHDEIVWESLVDVNGAASELFSGDFRVVSHDQDARLNQDNSGGGEEGWTTVQSRNRYHGQRVRPNEGALRVTNGTTGDGHETPPPLPGPRPSARQNASHGAPDDGDLGVPADAEPKTSEQEDHDLALALQLQEEEEDQQRQAEQRRRREQELSEQFLSNESNEGPRPPIPPRRANRGTTTPPTGGRAAVNRPSDRSHDPDAPPTYEQSASDRPYRPAGSTAPASLSQGNPLSAYDALRRQQSAYAQQSQSTSTVNSIGPGPQGHNRRPSQVQANRIRRRSSQMGALPGGYPGGAPGSPIQAGPVGGPSRVNQAPGVREAEDKCVVM